jgi:hypothetical protein
MSNWSLTRTVAALTGSVVVSYSGYVEYESRLLSLKLDRRASHKIFSTGSADDVLADNLITGDILLFSRRWYNHHIPMAVAIKLYQTIHKTDFDHCGIVICDPKTGVPYVYETSPWDRPRLKKFSEVILDSRAHQIILRPLLPRQSVNAEEEGLLLERLGRGDDILPVESKSECLDLYSGVLTTIVKQTLKALGRGVTFRGRSCECPNSKLIVNCWKLIGIDADIDDSELTCRDFVDESNPKLNLLSTSSSESGDTQPMRLGGSILVRTR